MPLLALMALLVGCTSESPPTFASLTRRRPRAADCAATPIPEASALCWLSVGAEAAEVGEIPRAVEACSSIELPIWRDECFFQAAEGGALKGHLEQSLSLCSQAGYHLTACFLHLAWWARPDDLLESAGGESALERVEGALAQVHPTLEGPAPKDRATAEAHWTTALWFDALYGQGRADPVPLGTVPEEHAAAARTAFAFEAVRLAQAKEPAQQIVGTVLSTWRGELPALEGAELPRRCWGGSTTSPPSPNTHALTTPVVHGGERLLAADIEEDLTIATLEALYFTRSTTPAEFSAWRDDPRPLVRATAARIHRLTAAEAETGDEPWVMTSDDPTWMWSWITEAEAIRWYRSGSEDPMFCPKRE